jgi:hypothetical protein
MPIRKRGKRKAMGRREKRGKVRCRQNHLAIRLRPSHNLVLYYLLLNKWGSEEPFVANYTHSSPPSARGTHIFLPHLAIPVSLA